MCTCVYKWGPDSCCGHKMSIWSLCGLNIILLEVRREQNHVIIIPKGRSKTRFCSFIYKSSAKFILMDVPLQCSFVSNIYLMYITEEVETICFHLRNSEIHELLWWSDCVNWQKVVHFKSTNSIQGNNLQRVYLLYMLNTLGLDFGKEKLPTWIKKLCCLSVYLLCFWFIFHSVAEFFFLRWRWKFGYL